MSSLRKLNNTTFSNHKTRRVYFNLSRTLLHICRQISTYNHATWPYLSILIPYFAFLQCYFIYITIFVDIPLFQTYFCYYIIVEFNLFLFALINKCACVEQYNRLIERENKRFYLKHISTCRKFKRSDITWILKTADRAEMQLKKYCFRIWGNYKITNKTYHLVS